MTLIQIALLISLSALGLRLLSKSRAQVPALWSLNLFRATLAAAVLIPITLFFVPNEEIHRPLAQVFSSLDRGAKFHPPWQQGSVPLPSELLPKSVPIKALERGFLILGWCLLLAFAIGAVRLVLQATSLSKRLKSFTVLREVGRVRVLITREAVPFSLWTPWFSTIVLPSHLLTSRTKCVLALRHEAHHHRAGDTWLAWPEALLAAGFFWHPAMRWIQRQLHDLQEFACDEAVAGHPAISPQAYARCLIEVAETAIGHRLSTTGTVGLNGDSDGSSLRRRVMRIMNQESFGKSSKQTGRFVVGVLALAMFVGTGGLLARAMSSQRELSMTEAKKYAESAGGSAAAIPITMNERVLKRINKFIATPAGRKWARGAFERLPSLRPMIEEEAKKHGVPTEVVAIPFIESSYRNDLFSPHKAAGLWQFIPATARHYDLKVDDSVDERLDNRKATVAAMKYLKRLHEIFGDWRLALKAYNEGEVSIERQIAKYGTRDPWVLEEKESAEGYLTSAMAALILVKNPQLVQ
jgi:membrane-bound lytic murein transglycosylase D